METIKELLEMVVYCGLIVAMLSLVIFVILAGIIVIKNFLKSGRLE